MSAGRPLDVAVAEALRGPRGANPLVGAVVTAGPDDAPRILATGHHRGRGTAHAEVDALAALARTLDGGPVPADATLWVTLEPCDHHGTTGPCSEAVLASGVRRVRYAVADPTGPDGGGAARLSAAGLDVAQVPDDGAAHALNRRWLRARDAGRPFVTGHLAQSLDGRVAAADGTSQWITGAASRRHAHEVRSRVDAIVVGTGTVLADDPRLTARRDDGTDHPVQPVPVVQGRRPVPAAAALRRGRDDDAAGAAGSWVHVPEHDPAALLDRLAALDGPWPHGGRRPGHVLIEGGPTVLSAWLEADLVDEVFVYQAPLVIGHGPSGLHWPAHTTLSQSRTLVLDDAETGGPRRLGDDILIHLAA
ncbi:bifunctional diaminohydroxyphosphoribosylaminopyrimidine deaminase/5-amino-6-(5-phosphoribosylamino)uracil reductase RibD [Citricoccus sp. SGAir0253]|uniref:bifunctional diaminohydroxyphosphoribosylaminopyrimidine deaminase/5-amino-6-(5-phosphoribosylamino)uracil reductase RibD n=1 Tax=Citricoccus sp. SGAir0253 TaxID=2567881 RepID=UPI0010CCE6B4|nr:bifunctional diaminohydroxyphosphoribosylaminopyrimidine deaminase/5-amino-6-(5-phosphoribosylamino)uracil reductase RibD [Citricoccus sp. SGAir0253]QCU78161.1 bifunctional diaminohydroxyphosphoribosylaminopyrimidine deaminase/5-amino-6-(5-phosphoribosylamino)uracil reductase RibD [Citricoccus sp. SGAir0253]